MLHEKNIGEKWGTNANFRVKTLMTLGLSFGFYVSFRKRQRESEKERVMAGFKCQHLQRHSNAMWTPENMNGVEKESSHEKLIKGYHRRQSFINWEDGFYWVNRGRPSPFWAFPLQSYVATNFANIYKSWKIKLKWEEAGKEERTVVLHF